MKKASLVVTLVIMIAALGGCGSERAAVIDGGENPELKCLMSFTKEDPNQYAVAKLIEEKTGYKVKYDSLPQDKADEKLNLIMASNEPYDFIFTKTDVRINWAEYAKKGALLELSELIDKYGANMKSVMSEKSFSFMQVDGKQFGIPVPAIQVGKSPSYSTLMAVREDWLEKENIKYPSTVDEFTNMLKLFATSDSDGQNISKSPLSIRTVIEIPGLVGAFGIYNLWNDVDGKLVNRVEDPRYLEYIEYLKFLYQNKLLDNEFPTNKAATLTEKFSSGRAGVIPMAYHEAGTIVGALTKNFPDAKVRYIDPLTGKNGEAGVSVGKQLDRMVFIPKSAKNPEHAVKYLDMKLEGELFKLIAIGEEGVHYTVENDEYSPIEPKFFDERNMANEYLTGIDEELYPKYWQARVKKNPDVYNAFKYLSLDDERLKYSVMNPVNDAPVMDSDKYSKVINQIANDYFIKVIAGELDIESSYSTFIEKWLSEGGAEMKKELNTWYQQNK